MSTEIPTDVATLVARLDTEQKIAQLHCLSIYDLMDYTLPPTPDGIAALDFDRVAGLRPHGVGHMAMTWLMSPDLMLFRRQMEDLQRNIREASPFGIGALMHGEGVSGLLHASGSQFPTAWAQAATFAPELTRRCAAVTSGEMQAAGIQLCFSPVLDVARDLRWGRIHETYGEDPELISQMGVAFVKGINGEHHDTGVTAVAKHFAGYAASEGALNQAVANLGRRTLVDVYAEPFRRAIDEAGLDSVMNSYNEIDGIPSVADRWLLTDFLRGELGLPGAVVSDYGSVDMLLHIYHTARTPAEAAAQALRAGLDVELPTNDMFGALGQALEDGLVDEADIDRAVTRVLTLKHRLGLIPEMTPPVRPVPAHRDADRAEAVADGLSRTIAEQAVVLLSNDGVLPLDLAAGRVVVVGPAADEVRIHFGAYTAVANHEMPLGIQEIINGRIPGIDPETAIFTDLFQPRLPGIDPLFEEAARRQHPEAPTVFGALQARNSDIRYAQLGSLADADAPVDADAVAAAVADADVVIAVVGERTGWVGNNTAGEGQTSALPGLPGNQDALLAALARTGRPVVTVVVSGRPLLLADAVEHSCAVLLAPLLGRHAGDAVAGAICGETNPSGKLPSTFPRTIGQVPMFHGHHYGSGYDHPTGTRHGYGDIPDNSPLFAFGHGLSYTDFSVELTGVAVVEDGQGRPLLEARCTVANTGARSGDTVVQVYARDEAAVIVRPVRQLLGFQRVSLEAGEKREIVVTAPVARLAYTSPDGTRGVEAGDVTVMAALASDDIHGSSTVQVPAVTA
ncbi:glycoside hydrolase family 3 N-terminal domain-containing protein [Streptomyces caniscabiei]|uniref:glycoside hydrolase family 3 N-terminal domain-containing protein n=1 Tax=Streptomyces caniscabiei TaxID=2746961 RepID=UPI0007661BE8|nr:glycoside hydrolase family 3 N-terminal domain-containing protein [Streptomyces caniscabiei]